MKVRCPCGFPICWTLFGGVRVHVSGPVGDVKVPSALNDGANCKFTNAIVQGPLSTLKMVCRFVPAIELPPVRVARDAAEIVHSRPAPTAVALLVSSPIHKLPLASRASRLVLPATKDEVAKLQYGLSAGGGYGCRGDGKFHSAAGSNCEYRIRNILLDRDNGCETARRVACPGLRADNDCPSGGCRRRRAGRGRNDRRRTAKFRLKSGGQHSRAAGNGKCECNRKHSSAADNRLDVKLSHRFLPL